MSPHSRAIFVRSAPNKLILQPFQRACPPLRESRCALLPRRYCEAAMLRSSLIMAVLLTGQGAQAQQPPASGLLQQIPPVAVPQKPAPTIRIERPEPSADAVPEGARIRVDTLRVTGAT